MTITKRGDPAGPRGSKRPSSIQSRYHRSSKEAGSNVFGSLRAPSSGALVAAFSGIKKGRRAPSKISKTRRKLVRAAFELGDPPLDGDLGRVGHDFPGDLPDHPIRELLDDTGRDSLDLLVGQLERLRRRRRLPGGLGRGFRGERASGRRGRQVEEGLGFLDRNLLDAGG